MSFKDQLFVLSQYAAPHDLISKAFGAASECRTPAIKNWMITTFIRKYGVDMNEAFLRDPLAYDTFNAFFTRALKHGARPLDTTDGAVLCPADGAVSQLGRIEQGNIFQAKGHSFTARDLLGGDAARAAPFMNGQFATVYMSPRDYHRVHMPLAGTLRETIYVPGRLFSVNPVTASQVPGLFARNERLVCMFDTELGPMAVVLVGAMIVGSMETVWGGRVAPHSPDVVVKRYTADGTSPVRLDKGAEMGRFLLGSTVVLLFGANRVRWDPKFAALVPTRMGERMAMPYP